MTLISKTKRPPLAQLHQANVLSSFSIKDGSNVQHNPQKSHLLSNKLKQHKLRNCKAANHKQNEKVNVSSTKLCLRSALVMESAGNNINETQLYKISKTNKAKALCKDKEPRTSTTQAKMIKNIFRQKTDATTTATATSAIYTNLMRARPIYESVMRNERDEFEQRDYNYKIQYLKEEDNFHGSNDWDFDESDIDEKHIINSVVSLDWKDCVTDSIPVYKTIVTTDTPKPKMIREIFRQATNASTTDSGEVTLYRDIARARPIYDRSRDNELHEFSSQDYNDRIQCIEEEGRKLYGSNGLNFDDHDIDESERINALVPLNWKDCLTNEIPIATPVPK